MVTRAERTTFGEWWWTIDRWLLFSFVALMVSGFLFGLAAYPPVANKLGLPTFHFVNRQAAFLLMAGAIMVGTSFLNPRQVRRLALLLFLAGLGMVILTLFYGAEVKGARRWLNLPGFSLQPSEILKPAFVVMAAWAFSERQSRQDMPSLTIAMLILPLAVVPLIRQPDLGQTILISAVWCGLFFLAGLHILWVIGLAGLGVSGLFLAYRFLPHVTDRIDRFLNKGNGDTFQTDMALESFLSGGWFGRGPGEGTVKRSLPDSHTDFLFSVIGEEFGAITCILVVLVFGFIVVRGMMRARANADPFCRMAGAGLVMLFGLQSFINMAVNLNLVPPKGMTLPFLSYGGSSLLSVALTSGFLLALTRKRPKSALTDRMPAHQAVPRGAMPQPAGG
ncbi:putative peptidoglycan glycosyltransferase FtsW [Rhabdaerophilum sp. SD176]|uniref:FtsW/RodA/SpoVE family cell cycle protein n=1 Tax=Rhabdaerophilum sp. SD176 TaxID=2983548 RepID=UPI0024DF47DD|nr:putative peptidoglycan glycosyltransferase FtsW [Rhabdaerophilum sp. SD176]